MNNIENVKKKTPLTSHVIKNRRVKDKDIKKKSLKRKLVPTSDSKTDIEKKKSYTSCPLPRKGLEEK